MRRSPSSTPPSTAIHGPRVWLVALMTAPHREPSTPRGRVGRPCANSHRSTDRTAFARTSRALARCGRAAREPEPDRPARAKRVEESEHARASTTPRNTRPRTRGSIRCSLRRASDVEVESEEREDADRPRNQLERVRKPAAVVLLARALEGVELAE